MNKRNAPKSKSLTKKLIVLIACLMFMQGVLYLGAILGAGTLAELNQNALRLFEHAAEYRSEDIQSNMVKKWSLPDYFNDLLQVAHEDLLGNDNNTNDLTVSHAMANQLEVLLRNSNATGAFVIYDDEVKDDRYTSFYLRDMEPAVYSKKDSDLLVSFGAGKLVGQMGLTMDYSWTTDFVMTENDAFGIYFKELQTEADKAKDLTSKDLGRWSGRLRMCSTEQDVIVYCLPLLNNNHQMYGVIGVEVSLEYLNALLPYEELTMNGAGGYVLGILQSNGTYKLVAKNSVHYQSLAVSGELKLGKLRDKALNIFTIEDDTLVTSALASVKPLRLYNSNTPFEKEEWALIGIVDENSLLASGKRLQWLLFWACIGALAVGAVCSIISTLIFSRPIQNMVKKLENSGNDERIHLQKSYVIEIDRLAEAVEKYSIGVADSASRLSHILHIMNQPLGAIEVDKENDTVYCAGFVSQLLNFSPLNQKRLKFTIAEFEDEISSFKKKAVAYEKDQWQETEIENEDGIHEQIIKCMGEDKEAYWISFKTVELQQKILTVVQDVTDEITEKLKIEYERDYDLLTNLLNRRSFRKRVMRLIGNGQIQGVSAMVMWDLDNLKIINDTYGHDFGDTYICEAAKVLQSLSNEMTIVSRMSGDEFLIFFFNQPFKHHVLNLVQATHNQLRNTILWLPAGDSMTIKASAGIVWHVDSKATFEELLKYADFAMYSAKGNMKGTIQEFDTEKYKREAMLFDSKDELKLFIEERQMRFQFQPIVEARTGNVFAYEALMRPFGEKITSIVEMMHLAKAQGKLGQIEFLTFMGVMEAYNWQRDTFGDAKLFFNSIANSRLSMEDFASFKRKFGNDLHRLVVEITDDERKSEDCLYFKQSHMKKWGIQIAIDDFLPKHMEHSLSKLSPQYIKIDMSIIRNIHKIEIHQNKVAEILAFTKPRNILSIAEGIETKEEMEMLLGLGVDFLQGYYIGRPSYEVQSIHGKIVTEIHSFYKID